MKENTASINRERDRLKSALRVGAHLLVLVSGVSLLLTEKLWLSSSLLLIACLITLLVPRPPRSGSFWEIASFLYLLFFFADWFWITGSLAPSLVHLFIFIIINKLFNLQSDRDYYQLYLLTFLSMLAATALSVEIIMLYMIFLFVILFVWNFMSMTLIKTWSKSENREPFPFSLFGVRYWGFIGLSTMVMIVFALGIFFLLPRAQLGYFGGMKPGETQHVSGFSQKVQLGEIAQIQENTEGVMRISVSGGRVPVGHRFYWRGAAFDLYDGKSWSTSNPGTSFLFQDSSSTFYASTDHNESVLVKQEVYLAPIDSRVIFGQDRMVKVEGSFFGVSRDVNGTLTGMGIPENYEVYSQITSLPPERLRSRRVNYSENVLRYYTKLQRTNPQIEKLAKDITTGQTNVYDRVKSIQTYLENNYQYTTTNLPLDNIDPVANFLFKKKVGHCEYFATSMVILLRHIGIPARIVNGFLEGEFNDIGKFYVVRQSDAHSWVEVYFGGGLWMNFDPSPRSVVTGGSTDWWKLFNPRKILESISFFWDRYILIFSAQDQINVLITVRDRYKEIAQALKEESDRAKSSKVGWVQLWQRYRAELIAIAAIPVLLFYAVRLHRNRKRKLELIRTPVLFYQEMLALLQQKGYEKPAATTPSEFAQHVSQRLPDPANADVTNLTVLFYKARFGQYSLTREDQAYVKTALTRLQQWK
jgi:protein-glutamine gamma-glutamyltransferase